MPFDIAIVANTGLRIHTDERVEEIRRDPAFAAFVLETSAATTAPLVNERFETNADGLFIAGELGVINDRHQ